MRWDAYVGISGIFDFLSQFGYAESKNGEYQKYFLRLDLLICIKQNGCQHHKFGSDIYPKSNRLKTDLVYLILVQNFSKVCCIIWPPNLHKNKVAAKVINLCQIV